ncbi:DUF7524 family protein [Salinilacihabitans rarus]|uniref:DUF7524 family protein n=1 Tax=Salinilacihabitans rarus TaxID=2961596 RepID=UPI0020C8B62C|nr:hypothetical protein [Salinilacihabitans rarus]
MPGASVTVHVNRGESGTLQAATTALETRGSFDLLLRGHDGPAHVHCKLAGDLATVARIAQPNYYVEPGEQTVVPVDVDDVAGPVEGTLEVSTGYGATVVSIDVTVESGPRVDVDETLADPPEPEPEDGAGGRLPVAAGVKPGTVAVLVLALLAVGVAALTAAVVGGAAAFVGFLIVVVGVAVAVALLLG